MIQYVNTGHVIRGLNPGKIPAILEGLKNSGIPVFDHSYFTGDSTFVFMAPRPLDDEVAEYLKKFDCVKAECEDHA